MADTQPGLLPVDAPSGSITGEHLPWVVAPDPLPRAGGHRAEGWGERNDPGARWYGMAPPPAAGPVAGGPAAPVAPPSLLRSPDGDPAPDASATPPTGSVSLHRPRHRPPVIDLTRADSPHRSPFG